MTPSPLSPPQFFFFFKYETRYFIIFTSHMDEASLDDMVRHDFHTKLYTLVDFKAAQKYTLVL